VGEFFYIYARSLFNEYHHLQIPYPLISLMTRLPQTLHGQCPLTFHTRTFEWFSLLFCGENEAIDVFESVKALTVTSKCGEIKLPGDIHHCC
jgi:myotubularin-related protein 6/7/8